MRGWTTLAVGAAAMTLLAQSAEAVSPAACSARSNNTEKKLLECVTLSGVREHKRQLQNIANRSNGNRFAGLPGHDRSVTYVARLLREAGYAVRVQRFDYVASTSLGDSALQQTAPTPTTYVEGTDFLVAGQSEPGDETEAVTAVDLQLGVGNTSTSGCEGTDFVGFPVGNIALVQRGSCDFRVKAENAATAGAVGVVIFNQGNTTEDDRNDLFGGTLGETYQGGIPVVTISYPLGESLSKTDGLNLRLFANVSRRSFSTANVLAETRGGRADNVVMVGAHLDSVEEGPGINDNGSGSAAILETALQMKNVTPRNKVRFAWWSAEESGLVGSGRYVDGLTDAQLINIALYINFDMVGSPNPVRFVYDGDGSAFGDAGPPGSAQIEKFFIDFYTKRGLASAPTEFDGRSDYLDFTLAGIPAGGLFTGAEGVKTPEEAATFGGTAGEPYDPCYHQACDDFRNVDLPVLDLNADAIAAVTLHYAKSTADVNGLRVKGRSMAKKAKSAERRGHLFVR